MDATNPAATAVKALAEAGGMSDREAMVGGIAAYVVDTALPGIPAGSAAFLAYTLARRPKETVQGVKDKVTAWKASRQEAKDIRAAREKQQAERLARRSS